MIYGLNKYIILISVFVIYTTIIFFSGWYARNKFIKPKIKIVNRTTIKTVPIFRNYKNLSYSDSIKELKKYDLGTPKLDGYMYNNIFKARAGLASRNWSRDFKLKITESSNYNFYIGLALGTVATVGIIYVFQKLH